MRIQYLPASVEDRCSEEQLLLRQKLSDPLDELPLGDYKYLDFEGLRDSVSWKLAGSLPRGQEDPELRLMVADAIKQRAEASSEFEIL